MVLVHLLTVPGRVSDEGNWLATMVPELQAQWESATLNQLEFSLLSVISTNSAATDVHELEKMNRVREDWGPFLAELVRCHAAKGDLASLLSSSDTEVR